MRKFRDVDIFGQPLPGFTLKGRKLIRTRLGSVCTIFIALLTFAFGLLKLQHLLERRSPIITQQK